MSRVLQVIDTQTGKVEKTVDAEAFREWHHERLVRFLTYDANKDQPLGKDRYAVKEGQLDAGERRG